MVNIFKSLKNIIYSFFDCLKRIDRVTLGILLLLICISSFQLINSLEIIEVRINKPMMLFKKHIFFLLIFFMGSLIMCQLPFEINVFISMCVGFLSIFLCILTLFIGTKINGSSRWINLYFISLQPSVFIKNTIGIFLPFLFKDIKHNIIFLIFCCSVVLFQPDLGMCIIILAIGGTELFILYDNIFENKYIFLGGFFISITFFIIKGKYLIIRLSKFFSASGLYQSNIAIKNIKSTYFFGHNNYTPIPDGHCDFIFASITSNYGIFMGLLIIFLYMIIFVRNIQHSEYLNHKHKIVLIGILSQISYQSIFHIASNLNFIPPKGVSCPFLSFGGSETLATIFTVGTLLSITKKKY